MSDTIDVEGEGPCHPSRYAIRISDLFGNVNMIFKSLLSQDALEHSGEGHPANVTYSDKVFYSRWDQIETKVIKRWFGNSQEGNKDGSPKVMHKNFSKNPKKFQKRCFNSPNVCYHNSRQGEHPEP